MNNIEIKARLPRRRQVAAAARDLGAKQVWTKSQRDVFFCTNRGYLKLRTHDQGASGELIAYCREPGAAPRTSDYDIVNVPDATALEEALTRSLGVRGVVRKTRTLYLWNHTRIHLDDVDGLGAFMELETVVRGISHQEAELETRRVMEALSIPFEDLLDRPYLELLEESGALETGS